MESRIDDSLVVRRSPALLDRPVLRNRLAPDCDRRVGCQLCGGAAPIADRLAHRARRAAAQVRSYFVGLACRLIAAGTTLGVGGAWMTGGQRRSSSRCRRCTRRRFLATTVVLQVVMTFAACLLRRTRRRRARRTRVAGGRLALASPERRGPNEHGRGYRPPRRSRSIIDSTDPAHADAHRHVAELRRRYGTPHRGSTASRERAAPRRPRRAVSLRRRSRRRSGR